MFFNANEPLLGIGLTAKKLGVSPELLRLYEREGLIFIHKTNSGHRLFSERDLEWIQCIREQITENKMKIAEVRLILALIPCWNINSKCSKKDCLNCATYKNTKIVCWTLTTKTCLAGSCRDCEVYSNTCQAGKLEHMRVVIEYSKKN